MRTIGIDSIKSLTCPCNPNSVLTPIYDTSPFYFVFAFFAGLNMFLTELRIPTSFTYR